MLNFFWRVGRLGVPDSWCLANCFVPTGTNASLGMAPACLDASGFD